MPDDRNRTPAVQAYEQEKARQRERQQKAKLDQALEDTFPASDPVSHAATSVPAGRADVTEAERVHAFQVTPREPFANPCPSFAIEASRWVRRNPLATLAVAAAVGWILGVSR